MSFGQNLQLLRKMRNEMTQEDLAERLGVSRQTISKWELDTAYPEINKVVELCKLFSCTMDELVREDMNVLNEAYSHIRREEVAGFSYLKYEVISAEPETDAIWHARRWAEEFHIAEPDIIGWDFPAVSQEQINVFHMHGYEAALILEEGMPELENRREELEVIRQEKQSYMAITIRFGEEMDPFRVIPNAYKALMTYMKTNGIQQKWDKRVLGCFEREYDRDGVHYMDVYIAAE